MHGVAMMRVRVFGRVGGEFRFAAGAAEEHVLPFMRETMLSVGFNGHAANRIGQSGSCLSFIAPVIIAMRGAAARRLRHRVFCRISLELGLAASAAEQHLLAFVHEPMRRVRLGRHAANGIARRAIGACMALMIVAVVVGVHS